LESEVPLGCLLSGGIDSSLISVAAQKALLGKLQTFNVRFSDTEYDETWAAQMVAKHIGSRHESLEMDDIRGTWDHVTGLLSHVGQPFADTSLFAVNAICRSMRKHVTVAVSGDGGDEAFGGYDVYWKLDRIALLQTVPAFLLNGAGIVLNRLSGVGMPVGRLSQRMQDLTDADDTSIVQSFFRPMSEREHKGLMTDINLLPVRRLFEPEWERHLLPRAPRSEHLSAHATEVNTRLTLANDFLFKVDIASMRESLEVRVPMLDEELFAFGLSLPRHLKVDGRTGKRILRAVATHRLPSAVANKRKWGFSIPLESWVDADLKEHLRDVLLGPSSRLPEVFRAEAYRPVINAFCDDRGHPTIARPDIYPRAIMLLSVHLALCHKSW